MSMTGLTQTFFFEDFESLPLGPNVNEAVSNSTAWTKIPPKGWRVDDSGVPGVVVYADGSFDENGFLVNGKPLNLPPSVVNEF